MDTTTPLRGYTIGITAARRSAELATMLTRRGAAVVLAPALQIVPLADDTRLQEATRRCLEGPVDFTVASTGIGFRGWIEAADGWGLKAELISRLQASALYSRGSKATGAMRAAGLGDPWSPESESSTDLLAQVLTESLAGTRVVVQQHGAPMPEFTSALTAAGAEVIEIPVYRWAPPVDEQPLQDLIERIAAGQVDVVTFTSAPAVEELLAVADRIGRKDAVVDALRNNAVAACVGPICAEPLRALGIECVVPERYRLGAMVRALTESLPVRQLEH
ncbi:MAG TPA: uroporphyrinogen-III synthase [Mycobacteriales bacterium]|nr:uroporphyrinogen-III synthase [Mycobacteriales bacterium]